MRTDDFRSLFETALAAAAACLAVLLWSPAQAQFVSSGHGAATTVQQARTAPAGTRVSLSGSLQEELRRAQYLFKDATGSIRVRIEREFWRGREVTNRTALKLRGRVDTDVRGRFIDVYYFGIVD